MQHERLVAGTRLDLGNVVPHFPDRDDSVRYITYLLFESLQFFVLNVSLYSDADTLSELQKYWSPGRVLPRVLDGLWDSIVSLLGVEWLRPPAPTAAKMDCNAQPSEQPLQYMTHFFAHRMLV